MTDNWTPVLIVISPVSSSQHLQAQISGFAFSYRYILYVRGIAITLVLRVLVQPTAMPPRCRIGDQTG
jgi:hypothetical protein